MKLLAVGKYLAVHEGCGEYYVEVGFVQHLVAVVEQEKVYVQVLYLDLASLRLKKICNKQTIDKQVYL